MNFLLYQITVKKTLTDTFSLVEKKWVKKKACWNEWGQPLVLAFCLRGAAGATSNKTLQLKQQVWSKHCLFYELNSENIGWAEAIISSTLKFSRIYLSLVGTDVLSIIKFHSHGRLHGSDRVQPTKLHNPCPILSCWGGSLIDNSVCIKQCLDTEPQGRLSLLSIGYVGINTAKHLLETKVDGLHSVRLFFGSQKYSPDFRGIICNTACTTWLWMQMHCKHWSWAKTWKVKQKVLISQRCWIEHFSF